MNKKGVKISDIPVFICFVLSFHLLGILISIVGDFIFSFSKTYASFCDIGFWDFFWMHSKEVWDFMGWY